MQCRGGEPIRHAFQNYNNILYIAFEVQAVVKTCSTYETVLQEHRKKCRIQVYILGGAHQTYKYRRRYTARMTENCHHRSAMA